MFFPTLYLCNILIFQVSCNKFNAMIVSDSALAEVAGLAALQYLHQELSIDVDPQSIIHIDCTGTVQSCFETNCRLYNSKVEAGTGPHLIIGLTSSSTMTSAFRLFLQTVQLPATTISYPPPNISKWLIEETNDSYLIEFLHPLDMIPHIVPGIIKSKCLTSAALLFDNTFIERTDNPELLLRDLPVRLIVINVELIPSLKHLMAELKSLDIFNYFVLGSVLTAKLIMESAECGTYYNQKFSWFIITQENVPLRFSCGNVTALLIAPVTGLLSRDNFFTLRSFYSLKMSYNDLSSAFYFNVVVKSIMSFRSFLGENYWILTNFTHPICHGSNVLMENRKTIDFKKSSNQDSDPMILAPLKVNDNGRGYMDVSMRMDLARVLGNNRSNADCGVWRPGLDPYGRLARVPEYPSCSRPIYKIVTVLQPPFSMRTIDADGHETFTGYCVDLLEDLSRLVGFDYELYVEADNNYGAMDDQGQWGGLIKELIDKKADIGLTCLSITTERLSVVDFTVPYYDLVGTGIMMKRHSPKKSHFKFLAAMEGEVWLCVMIIYIIASLLLWVFEQFKVWLEGTAAEATEDYHNLCLKDCFWLCMTSLTPQGGGKVPSTLPGYITVGTWWLFGVIVISSYTANLAALLTVARLETPIQSLADLAAQSGVQYAPVNGSAAMTFFERMADIEHRFHSKWKEMTVKGMLGQLAVGDYPLGHKWSKLWKNMCAAGLPQTTAAATQRVLMSKSSTEGFAHIGDSAILRYEILTNCELQMVGEEFSKLPFGIALQKNSPLKESLNKGIMQLLNQRKLQKLKEIWWDENPEQKVCDGINDSEEEGIYLSNIGGVYTLILSGLMLSWIILGFEYYNEIRVKRRENLGQLETWTLIKP